MHAGGQHRGGGSFGCVGLKPHTQFAQQPLRIGQHIHQMTNRRALITANIADAVFQQSFGQRQNTLAGKDVAFA